MKVSNINAYKTKRQSLENINFGKVLAKLMVIVLIFNCVFTTVSIKNKSYASEYDGMVSWCNSLGYEKVCNLQGWVSDARSTYAVYRKDGIPYIGVHIDLSDQSTYHKDREWWPRYAIIYDMTFWNDSKVRCVKSLTVREFPYDQQRKECGEKEVYRIYEIPENMKGCSDVHVETRIFLDYDFKHGNKVFEWRSDDFVVSSSWWNSHPTIAITKPNGNEYFV